MIAETLLPLAKLLDGSDLIGEQCFLFERCEVDFEELNKNIAKLKGKNLTIPIIFFGKAKKSTVSGFAGSGKANASKGTFQKKGIEYPTEIFRHKEHSFNTYNITTLLETLGYIQNLSEQELNRLFSSSLQPFSFKREVELQSAIKKAVCLPVTPNAPSVIIHGLLVLNAVNQHSFLINIAEYKQLLPVEILRFILLFWFIDSLPGKALEHESKAYDLVSCISIGGNLAGTKDLLKTSMLISLADNEIFGGKSLTENMILNYVKTLTCDDNADTIKISGRSYTAPKTGISPTSAYIDLIKKENALTDLIRNGADNKEMIKRLDNYATLISGTRFFMGTDLYYYFFPEKVGKAFLEKYITAIKRHVTETKKLKDDYFSESNKTKSVKRDETLKCINKCRETLWVELLLEMNTESLFFVFEKNAGNSNQPFFSWTKIYQNIETLKAFIFLFNLDDHSISYPLTKVLHLTGHNLSEGWGIGEKERLIDFFMNKRAINWLQQWQRWRKFFLRNDLNENPFDSKCWEGAFYFIMLVNEILNFSINKGETGEHVLQKFQKMLEAKMKSNEEEIIEYLNGVFHSEDEKVKSDIKKKAGDYSRFVDTSVETKKWQSVLDGLICGWALKSICRKLRPDSDDYKKVIGGRALSKMSPFDVNEKMVDLREKAIRQDNDAWNVDVPMEKLIWYSQQNANSENIRLFSDALALGFMRFDNKHTMEEK